MKALSLARPWPTLMLDPELVECGVAKGIENRTWSTGYRGPIVLHAAQSWDDRASDVAKQLLWDGRRARTAFLRLARDLLHGRRETSPGHVAVVKLVDVCSLSAGSLHALRCECGPWAFPGHYHWQIADPRLFPSPIPGKGRLGLWTPPDDARAAALALLHPSKRVTHA